MSLFATTENRPPRSQSTLTLANTIYLLKCHSILAVSIRGVTAEYSPLSFSKKINANKLFLSSDIYYRKNTFIESLNKDLPERQTLWKVRRREICCTEISKAEIFIPSIFLFKDKNLAEISWKCGEGIFKIFLSWKYFLCDLVCLILPHLSMNWWVLDASTHLHIRVLPCVHPSVCPSIRLAFCVCLFKQRCVWN